MLYSVNFFVLKFYMKNLILSTRFTMSLCFLSLETNKIFNELILKKLEDEGFDGLSLSLVVLFPYFETDENISISNLAKKLGYTRQAMHKNLKKLESLDYITFEVEENKKEKLVKTTNKSKKLMQIANDLIIEIQNELSKKIGKKQLQEYIKNQGQIFDILSSRLSE